MKFKFSSLQNRIWKSISDTRDLAKLVLGMKILSEDDEEKVRNTPNEVDMILTKYWSFLDYENFEHIVENMCGENEMRLMKVYSEEVKRFCERRVSELPPDPFGNGPSTSNGGRKKLCIALDLADPALKHIKDLKIVIANILGCRTSELVLHDIGRGSVLVTFLLTASIGARVFKTPLTAIQKATLREEHVISLTYDSTVFFSEKEIQPKEGNSKPIVITGFGPIGGPRYGSPNLSEKIVQMLYHDLPDGKFAYNNEEITILTGPGPQAKPTSIPCGYDHDPTGIPCSYDCVKSDHFDTWLKSTDARIYVHLGIAPAEDHHTVYFEKVAYNYPVNRKNCDPIDWTGDYMGHYNEKKACIPGSDQYLVSSFDIPVLIKKVIDVTRNPEGLPAAVNFQESYNAGRFLCNFLYYRSLYYANCKGNADVIFIHVPEKLPQGVGMNDMVCIIKQIVSCLLDMQNDDDIKDEDVSQDVCPEPASSDELWNQSDNSDPEELHNAKGSRKWHYRKLTRKQARNAHRRRKRKWKSRQRKDIK